MFTFDYAARDNSGKLIKGQQKAKSRYEAIALLKHKGLTIIDLSQLKDGKVVADDKTEAKKKKKKLFDLKRVSLRDLAVFSRQLSVSINSGMSVIDALHSISEDMDNPYFQEILGEVA